MKKLYERLARFLLPLLVNYAIFVIRFRETPSLFHIIILLLAIIYCIIGNISFRLDSIYKKVTFNIWCISLIALVLMTIFQVNVDKKVIYIIFTVYAVFVLLWGFFMGNDDFLK